MKTGLLKIISYQSGLEEIDEDKSLSELGLDSIDVEEISMAIEDELGVTVSAAELEGMKTVKDLIAFLESKS